MKKILFLYFLFSALTACKNGEDKARNNSKGKAAESVQAKNESHSTSQSPLAETPPPDKNQPNSIEIFDADLMLFNGKVKRFFSLKDFKKNFGEPDSTQLMSREEPCSYVFENIDATKNLNDKFLYKNGSRFENSNEKVAIDEFKFTKNNFLVYKGITFNASTTIAQLKEIFPNAVENIGIMNVYGEGELQMIQLREGDYELYDGHINIFLKNGKLYFMHWWIPC
ncbi:hypothetical protein [Chryseobacterium vrystaatense]|uniref:Lipoprotein n=1 Tax=Chryseobacterium vrystaatense TaxID=307480 RepID=A0A1M5DTH3_9FLAO|nr:hypothetical protein [Chryseobacterium vrystaatense]SHF70151.1 hypothetical protein SAMN02787073_2708 [Chryseobacterium vrystaatense]